MPEDIRDRINRVEWNQEKQEERLNQGAQSFSDVRQAVEDTKASVHHLRDELQRVSAPKPIPWTWVAGFAFSALMVAGSVLWTFAQYPDDQDFKAAQKVNAKAHMEIDAELGGLEEAQGELATEQRLIQQSQKNQAESLESIDGKIDRLLEPRHR